MFPGGDNLSTAVESAKERDLEPLAEECADLLDLDREQLAKLKAHLQDAWFFGIRTGHAVMAEAKMGQADPEPVILGMQEEFQELMERVADDLSATVGLTIAAWDYLGRAWVAGAKFWEVEIAARLIEAKAGSFEDAVSRLEGN